MGKPMPWILTRARRLSMSVLRERVRTPDIPEEVWLTAAAESPYERTEQRLVLSAAMRVLSDEERQIVVLHAVTGLKHIEIARLLALPLPTVLSKYSRARKKLEKTLREGDGDAN